MRKSVAGRRKSLLQMRKRYLCRSACSGRSRNGLGRGPIGAATRRLCKVRISWQVQHFGEPRCRFRGKRAISAALARTHRKSHWHWRARRRVQISWQAQHFRMVEYRFRGRRSTFATSGTDFVAGAILSQGQVQISWQAQYFVIEGAITLFQLQFQNRKI